MPETSYTNGYVNGHMPYDMEDGSNFLFTSESVGEGHPGEYYFGVLQIWLPYLGRQVSDCLLPFYALFHHRIMLLSNALASTCRR